MKKLIFVLIPVSAHAQMAEVVSTIVNGDIPVWEKVLLAVIVAVLGVIGFFLWKQLPKMIDTFQARQNKVLTAKVEATEALEIESVAMIREIKKEVDTLLVNVAKNTEAVDLVRGTLAADKKETLKWQEHINNRINAAHRDICRLRAVNDSLPDSERFEAVLEYFCMKGNGSMVKTILPVIIKSRDSVKEWERAVAAFNPAFLTDHYSKHFYFMLEKISKSIF